jgi:hypothetical protein
VPVAGLVLAGVVLGVALRAPPEAVLAGALAGVLLTLAGALDDPVTPTAVTTPCALLTGDRHRGQLVGPLAAVLGGLLTLGIAATVSGLLRSVGLDRDAAVVLPAVLGWGVFLLPAVCAGAAISAACSEWGLLGVTRLWLAARGRAPLRLLTLLEDARRRGVLRQVGGVYEFRHACLVTYLTRPRTAARLS